MQSKQFSYIFILLLSMLCISCSTVPEKQGLQIKRVILLNHSSKILKNVRVYVSNTSELVSCGTIFPKTECSTGFRLRDYQGNSFEVTWEEEGRQHAIRDIKAKLPQVLQEGKPVNAVISFGESGQFSAVLKY